MTETSTSQPFKHYFDAELAANLAARIQAVYPSFAAESFIERVAAQVEPLELKGRVAVIAAELRAHLPAAYPEALTLLLSILGPPHSESEGMFNDGWYLMPLAAFVELYGLEHFDESMAGLHAITQRHTAEFAVRPFFLRYPERTLAMLEQWVYDESFHVRRLVSEGSRPRLPWATRLPAFIADPTPTLALLEQLKDDPSAYVRKSVANHLNDIAKDHPDLILATLERWNITASDGTRWIIRHALRTLVKQGHPEALRLLGADAAAVRLSALHLEPERLRSGDTLRMTFTLESTASTAQHLIIDYVLHFAGAGGKLRPKVFKLRTQTLAAGEILQLTKQYSFKPVTTRRYYPGLHRVEIQVNGVVLGGADFTLMD